MKIGILTYHRAHNYGAVLQAYALRTFLQKQGHDVEFVDYWPDSHEEKYKTFLSTHLTRYRLSKKVNISFRFCCHIAGEENAGRSFYLSCKTN